MTADRACLNAKPFETFASALRDRTLSRHVISIDSDYFTGFQLNAHCNEYPYSVFRDPINFIFVIVNQGSFPDLLLFNELETQFL